MFSAETLDLLVTWTPLAVAFLALVAVVLAVSLFLLYAFRTDLVSWFAARWSESSSKHARTVAITATAAYIGSRLGIPGVDPVSLNVVLTGWAVSLYMFVHPDGTVPVAVPPAVTSCLVIGLLAFGLSGCTGFDAAWSGANNFYSGQLKTTQKNIQGTNDNSAATWADAGCAIPYGEVVRNGSGNPNLPAAVITLCGSPSGYTMIHSSPTATATTTIPTEAIPVPAPISNVAPSAPVPVGPTPSSSAAPVATNKNTAQAQAATSALAAKIAALMQQH